MKALNQSALCANIRMIVLWHTKDRKEETGRSEAVDELCETSMSQHENQQHNQHFHRKLSTNNDLSC